MPSHPALRRALATTVAAALLVPLHLGLTSTPAVAGTRVSARIHASSSTVAAGRAVRLSARLTEGGTALRGAVVTLQRRVHGKQAWKTLTRTRTDRGGRVTVEGLVLHRSHDFRLRYVGSASTPPTVSASIQVQAQQAVSIESISDLHPVAGDSVTLTGAASPGIHGRRAYLQLATPHGWRSVDSTRVPVEGDFSSTVRSMRAGEQRYRFLVVGEEGVEPAASGTQTFVVGAWYRLADLPTAGSTSFGGGPRDLAGSVYEDSVSVALASRTRAWAEWTLDYSCSRFRATLAPDDSSAGSSARFVAQVDDARPVDVLAERGSPVRVEADVSGGDVLRLTSFALAGDVVAAWGDAELLCYEPH